eukprot:431113_1
MAYYANSESPFDFPALWLDGDMIRDYDRSYQLQKDTYIEKSNDGLPVLKVIGTLDEEHSQSPDGGYSFISQSPPADILHSLSESTPFGGYNLSLHYERGGHASDTSIDCTSPSKSKSETPTSFLDAIAQRYAHPPLSGILKPGDAPNFIVEELEDSLSDGYKSEAAETHFFSGPSHMAEDSNDIINSISRGHDVPNRLVGNGSNPFISGILQGRPKTIASNKCPLPILREVASPSLNAPNDPVTITAESNHVHPLPLNNTAISSPNDHNTLAVDIPGVHPVITDPKTHNLFETPEFGDSSRKSVITTAPSEARTLELNPLVLDDKICIDVDNNTKAGTGVKTQQHTGTALKTNLRVRSANNTSSIFAFVILLGLVALYSTKTDGRASIMSISGSSWRGHSAKHPGDHPSSSSGGLWGRASTILLVVAISVGATGLTGAVVWWWYRAHFPHTTPSTQEMLEKYYL